MKYRKELKMSQFIEITDKTVDEAITTACRKLGVTSSKLEFEIIQREKAGFLGIGAKPAIIKARIKDTSNHTQEILDKVMEKAEKKIEKEASATDKKSAVKEEKPAPAAPAASVAPAAPDAPAKEEQGEEKREHRRRNRKGRRSGRKEGFAEGSEKAPRADRAAAGEQAQVSEEEKSARPAQEPRKKPAVVPQLTQEQIDEIKQKAHAFLMDVFGAMNMEVEIKEDYNSEKGLLMINIEGDDMGILIGKRGQTLDSLQYLVSLIVNKGIDGYIHVKADTENYRERRKKTLENLARNIAFKVKKTRRPVALEPMNPYERRIIHSALQGDKFVTTYSEGEEPNRKVIVTLKKQ